MNVSFQKKQFRNHLITYLLVIAFFGISQILVNTGVLGSLYGGLLIPMCYYVIMAISLNLVVGILGELSLGHAGFVCIGAFTGAIFAILMRDAIANDVLRYVISLAIGFLAAGLAGLLICLLTLRLQGDYLAIVTLAFGEIIYKLIQNCYLAKDKNGLHFSFSKAIDATKLDLDTKKDILNGAMAVNGVPRTATVLSSVILVLLTLLVLYHFVDSRAGRACEAIRDNRIAAESIGISITKYKLIAFFISSGFAGIAGVMYASSNTLAANKFNYNMSILILVFVVLGGLGNMRGSIIAAIILWALPELLRSFQSYRMLLYAIILIVMMIVNNNETCQNFIQRIMPKKKSKTEKEDE